MSLSQDRVIFNSRKWGKGKFHWDLIVTHDFFFFNKALSTWILYQENKVGEPLFFPFTLCLPPNSFFQEGDSHFSLHSIVSILYFLLFLLLFFYPTFKKFPNTILWLDFFHHYSEWGLNILIVATVFNLKVKLEKKF